MNDRNTSNQGLLTISELLKGCSDTRPKVNNTVHSNIYSRNRYIGGSSGFLEQEVELVVLSSADITQLYRFSAQLHESLMQQNSFGYLAGMISSRSKGTTFKIALQPDKLGGLIDELLNMPVVENLAEDTVREPRASSSTKKYTLSLAPFWSPSKRKGIRSPKIANAGQVREAVLN